MSSIGDQENARVVVLQSGHLKHPSELPSSVPASVSISGCPHGLHQWIRLSFRASDEERGADQLVLDASLAVGSVSPLPCMDDETRAVLDLYVTRLGLGPGLYLLSGLGRTASEGPAWVEMPDPGRAWLRSFWAHALGQRCDAETRLCPRLGPGQFGAFARGPLRKGRFVCTYDAGGVVQLCGEPETVRVAVAADAEAGPSDERVRELLRERDTYKFTNRLPRPDGQEDEELVYNVYGNPTGTCPGPMINSCAAAAAAAVNCSYTVYLHVALDGRATLRTLVFAACDVDAGAELLTCYGDNYDGHGMNLA
jgi:hypothetical protein